MKFSQNDEESHILNFYKDKSTGKFIDIGAYHTERFSNTRALYLKGFKGVFVEPSPSNFKGIEESYKDDPEITVLNVAIGAENGEIDFYACEDAVSTSEISHMEKWGAAGVKYEKIKVPQISVVDFMNQYGHGTDFLSIDTESTNIIVFRCVPDWVWEEISLLCIEHDENKEEIIEKLGKFGFIEIYSNAENILMAK